MIDQKRPWFLWQNDLQHSPIHAPISIGSIQILDVDGWSHHVKPSVSTISYREIATFNGQKPWTRVQPSSCSSLRSNAPALRQMSAPRQWSRRPPRSMTQPESKMLGFSWIMGRFWPILAYLPTYRALQKNHPPHIHCKDTYLPTYPRIQYCYTSLLGRAEKQKKTISCWVHRILWSPTLIKREPSMESVYGIHRVLEYIDRETWTYKHGLMSIHIPT